MKFRGAVMGFLACAVLMFCAAPAMAAVKSSKSNSSDRVLVCHDAACCKAHPDAITSGSGQPCSSVLREGAFQPVLAPLRGKPSKDQRVTACYVRDLDGHDHLVSPCPKNHREAAPKQTPTTKH